MALATSLMLGTSAAMAHPGSATATPQLAQLVFNNSSDPADGFSGTGRPTSRSSGGSRGECDDLLVALLPSSDSLETTEAGCSPQSFADLALTIAAKPIIWVHLPELAEPLEGELAVLDENQRALSIQTMTLPGTAGIVGIQVEPTLERDRTYYWVFTVLADPQIPSQNPRVEGMLRRIEPEADWLTSLEATNHLREQAAIWAEAGVWHEALTALVSLRQTTSDDAAALQDWQDFLGSVGLTAIVDAPIQDCCYQ